MVATEQPAHLVRVWFRGQVPRSEVLERVAHQVRLSFCPPRGRVGPQIHLTFSQAGSSLPVLTAALTSPPLSPGMFLRAEAPLPSHSVTTPDGLSLLVAGRAPACVIGLDASWDQAFPVPSLSGCFW